MEKRKHSRVVLPFQVEISHASLGRVKTTATNISASGLFVELNNPTITRGATVKMTVLNMPLIESPPTPSIKMAVTRISEQGLGLEFPSNTSKHLWESVKRARNSLLIGEDYFQVFQNAIIVNPKNQILLAQQTGKWLLPGGYLKVGQDWELALKDKLGHELGIHHLQHVQTMGVDAYPDITSKEAAIFTVFQLFSTSTSVVSLSDNCQYTSVEWVSHERNVNEMTFSHPLLRTFVVKALNQLEDSTEASLTD
ncbi:MAG: PilZ domain-containing protein [Pseudomonadales bacterium]|nr:PilZ domain-containing protein [Pseudomonadales bacterium]